MAAPKGSLREISHFHAGDMTKSAFTDVKKITKKSVILGDSGIGKTSLLTRYAGDVFPENTRPTVGADHFFFRRSLRNGEEFVLHQWDTASQERYHSLVPMYIRGTNVVIFTFDITDTKSFANLVNIWYPIFDKYEKETENIEFIPFEKIIKILVGNKLDLDSKHDIEFRLEVSKFAIEKDMTFFEASAKDGTNISGIFDYIFDKLLSYEFPNIKLENIVLNDENKNDNKTSCFQNRC